MLLNIDETHFSPEALNNRSWLKKEINWEMFNQNYNGAISVILAISSEGYYIVATLNKRLDFSAFIEYLKWLTNGLILIVIVRINEYPYC